eukprot:9068316-Alexandrium_andersonii.AAC.1
MELGEESQEGREQIEAEAQAAAKAAFPQQPIELSSEYGAGFLESREFAFVFCEKTAVLFGGD